MTILIKEHKREEDKMIKLKASEELKLLINRGHCNVISSLLMNITYVLSLSIISV